MTIAEPRGGEDYSNTNAFSLARSIIELIDFLKLGGSGGNAPQEKNLIFQSLRMASETKLSGLGRSLACCLYTVASVNSSVKICTCILYHKEPFGDYIYVNSIVHEHIHTYM